MERCEPAESYTYPLGLFEAYGVELEYVIVDRETLNVRPWCDRLLQHISGTTDGEIYPEGIDGPVAWSNELALHVVEFKTASPVPSLEGIDRLFAAQVRKANDILGQWNACLMPGAMHPWMDPVNEMQLWPYGSHDIYRTFHQIFDCRGHGWANLQSIHINLPFSNNREFFKLHTAIRALLPLLPALAASSPIVQGKCTGIMDNRLEYYRKNCSCVPQVTGKMVPESARTKQDYDATILQPIYRALEPLDPDGVLRHEWVNARGAIARFDRGAIEIRLLDIQECPKADAAIAALICAVVQALTSEQLSPVEEQYALATDALHAVLMDAIRYGDSARIQYAPLLRCLNISNAAPTMGAIWEFLAREILPSASFALDALSVIFQEGCLAKRITKRIKQNGENCIFPLYQELCEKLNSNNMFTG